MIEKILRFSITYPIVVIFLTLIAAGLGFYSFTRLPIDAVPDITNNQVQINTSLPGYSPTQMEKRVTYVIETTLAGIPGLQMTRSLSRNAFSQVTAIFDDNVDIYFARQQINERLSEAKTNLPPGADPKMGPISTGLGEIYMWAVDFKHPGGKGADVKKGMPGWQPDGTYLTPEAQTLSTDAERSAYLRTVQDWIVKPQLKGIQGLAGVDSIGGYVKQYHIEPNIDRMIALGFSFDDIIRALESNNVSVGPGYIEKRGETFLIKSDEQLSSPTQIDSIVIATRDGIPIRIGDIAEVRIGKEMRTGSASKDGNEVVVGTAMMLMGANSRTVAQAVDRKLQEVNRTLPNDIEAEPILNRTKLVNATIHTVSMNLIEGALLVIAVLFLFLGQIRAALIAAAVIPLSMLLTATGMVQSKISGNLMSLGAIDFGLIVDGAVIITENCLRRLRDKQKELGRLLQPAERQAELIVAGKEMIQPTVFGQAIIIIVYVPILILTGIEGKMFFPMAMTVIMALLGAFVLSLTFVPAMISFCVTGHLHEKENIIVEYTKKAYSRVLASCLRHPSVAITSGVVIFLLSVALFYQLGEEFAPTLDERDIAMQATRIPSTSLTQSTQMQKDVEKVLTQFPQVAYVYSKTGTAEMASDPMPPNASDTFIMLKPTHEWPQPPISKLELIDQFQAALDKVPGNKLEFTQPIELRFNELISGERSDVAVKIYGDEFETMQRTAEEIANVLRKIPGGKDIKVSQTEGLPVLDIKIDREQASRLGVNVSDGLQVLEIAAGGGKAGQVFEGDRRFDLIVRLPEALRENVEALSNLPVPLPRNAKDEGAPHKHFPHVPLGEIAKLSISEGLNEIKRENSKRFISVQANVRGIDLGTFVEMARTNIHEKVTVPDGYWLEWGGQFQNMLSARARLATVVPICLVLIFFLLFTAFNSMREASLVFSGVPFALTGGILALWLRDMPFSISAAVGFIALSGIAVLNGLILISCIDGFIKAKRPLVEAITEGSLQRVRPVLMTALVASLGFVPMALATGTGAEVQKPLATVVIGGVISSTLLTLLILPALYKVFARKE